MRSSSCWKCSRSSRPMSRKSTDTVWHKYWFIDYLSTYQFVSGPQSVLQLHINVRSAEHENDLLGLQPFRVGKLDPWSETSHAESSKLRPLLTFPARLSICFCSAAVQILKIPTSRSSRSSVDHSLRITKIRIRRIETSFCWDLIDRLPATMAHRNFKFIVFF